MEKLSAAVQSFDADEAAKAAKMAVDAGMNPVMAIEKGLAIGLRVIGHKFEEGELWLPHLVLGAVMGIVSLEEVEICGLRSS